MQIQQQVDKINGYGEDLLAINQEIAAIEAGGIERANDLRDIRNQILDEMAELTDIRYGEDQFGDVWVQIEGVDFVKGGMHYEIGLKQDLETGFYTPFWTQNANFTYNEEGQKVYIIDNAKVFDLSREISSDLDTDVGGLKAMVLARGDHRADYTDIANGNYDDISQSIIMNLQAEFDQMVHNMVTEINKILADAAGVTTGNITLADGTVLQDVRYCESDADAYMHKEDGAPAQMFDKVVTDSYLKVTDINGKEYWVYQEEDFEHSESLYTLKNLQIDRDLQKAPASLGFMLPDGSVDMKTAEALKEAFTEEKYVLNPNVQKKTTFVDYYTDLVSQVANSGYVYRSIYENQQATVESTESSRQQIIGVSSDEELASMIKFQNAYNASSRYINVVDEMLEHILNTLGV